MCELVRPVTVSQESTNHEIGDLAAQPLTRREVEPEMLPGENPAQRRLLRGIAGNVLNERVSPGRTSDVTLKLE